MRHFFVSLYFSTCIVFLFGASAVLAQNQEAIIIVPTDNAVDVVLKPEITIETNFLIDSSSVSWNHGCPDSAVCALEWPTVFLLPKLLLDSLPVYLDTLVDVDSLLPKLAIGGEYEFLNDTTLVFTPAANLAYGTDYIAIVKNLKVIVDTSIGPGGPDTISVDEDSVTFRTVYPTHGVVASNVSPNGIMRCNDTLGIRFNRPLNSDTSATGPIVYLKRLDSLYYDSGDTIYLPIYDTIAITTWLHASDSSLLMIDPPALIPGDRYELIVETHRLTGDTLDDIFYDFFVKKSYQVELSVVDEDTTLSAPPGHLVSYEGTSYHVEGETVRLSALTEDPDYAFVRWECPELPGIDGETEPSVTFAQSCVSLSDVSITAVFRRIDSLQVTLVDTSDGWVMAYKYNTSTGKYDLAGGAGNYYLAPYESLVVFGGATAGTGMQFAGWKSNSPGLNSLPTPQVSIINKGLLTSLGGGGITLEPGVGTAPGGPNCCLCTEIHWISSSGNTPGYDPNTVLNVTPNSCITNDPNKPGNPACPVPTVVTAAVTSSCVEIAWVGVLDETGGLLYEMQWPAGSGPSAWTSSAAPNPAGGPPINLNLALRVPIAQCPTVYFYVRPSEFKLDVYAELEDARQLEQGQVGKDRDVRVSVYRFVNGQRQLLGITENQAVPTSNRMTFTSDRQRFNLFCDEKIEVVAEYNLREQGYTFEQWSDDVGYTYPATVTQESFQFFMDQDREVKGIFKEHFRLRKVGAFVADATDASSNPPTWYLPRSIQGGMLEDLNVWLSEVDNTHYGTKVHLFFNDPVDEDANGTKYNLGCREITQRIDYPNSNVDNVSASTRGSWSWQHWTLINSDRELVFELGESGIVEGIPRGAQFDVHVSQQVVNTTGQRLYPEWSFMMETEMPGVEVYIESITALRRSGDFLAPDPELYSSFSGKIIDGQDVETQGADGILPAEEEFPPDVPIGTPQTYGGMASCCDYLVVQQEKMDKDGTVALSVASFDYDGYDGIYGNAEVELAVWQQVLLALLVFAVVVGGSAALILLGLDALGIFSGVGGAILSGVLSLAGGGAVLYAVVAAAAAIWADRDDVMGTGSWMYLWGPNSWFGAHPSQSAQQHRPGTENNKVGYDVKFKLKK